MCRGTQKVRSSSSGRAEFCSAHDATQVGGVGDAGGGVAKVGGAGDHRLGCDGAIAEGEGGVGAEFDGGEGHEILNSAII